MAESSANPGGTSAESAAAQEFIQPSVLNALPHFLLLLIFPLVICAALYGGWWIMGPFLFIWLENTLDLYLGLEERNMDPWGTRDSQLYLYNLAIWMWAVLWPVVLVFVLWQIFNGGHLALWEAVLVVFALGMASQMVLIICHELVHKRYEWERRFGEFLLASVTYPHYATEHVYIHHPLVATPADLGSARKGQSFWEYFPRDVANNLVVAWRFECDRLARRHLPVWHYTNPFWRYFLMVAFWYALGYWFGGIWGILAFLMFSARLGPVNENHQLCPALRIAAYPPSQRPLRTAPAATFLEQRLQAFQLDLLQRAAPCRPPCCRKPAISAVTAL